MPRNHGRKYDRLWVACVTPYKKGGTKEVDETATREYLRAFMTPRWIEAGGGVIVNPEAGEVFYLSREEKKRNVEIAVEECDGKVPVFAGVFGYNLDDAVLVAKDAKDVGVDGLFWFPPQGNMEVTNALDLDRFPEVWINPMKAIDQAIDLPIIVHPSGGHWPPAVQTDGGPSPTVTRKIAEAVPNVVGWKMLYQEPGYLPVAMMIKQLEQETGQHVGIFPAGSLMNWYWQLSENLFDGTVSVVWNYTQEPSLDVILAWRRNDVVKAREVWHRMYNFFHTPFPHFHIAAKFGTWLRGFIPNPLARQPLPTLAKEDVLMMKDALVGAGLSVISDEKIREVTNQLPSVIGSAVQAKAC